MKAINIERSVAIIGSHIESSPNSHFSLIKKNNRIDLRTYNKISYLKKGNVSIYRLENDILTLSIPAPAILGMAQMRNEKKSHYIRCDSDCEMWVIDINNAVELFNENNLWMHAFDILTSHLQKYFIRENLSSHPTVRGVVLEHLKHIWAMPEEVRHTISVHGFILARNHISRSAVNNVLRDLISDGSIRIHRGKLLWLRDDISHYKL